MPESGLEQARLALAPWEVPLGLRAIDSQLALQFRRMDAGAGTGLLLAAALASRATADGHVCLELSSHAGRCIAAGEAAQGSLAGPAGAEDAADDGNALQLPSLAAWQAELRASSLVGEPGSWAPLILDGQGRLYLYRYWRHERSLAADLWARSEPVGVGVDDAQCQSALSRLFPSQRDGRTDWQKVAAAAALVQRFCVISGGPGTGKTTTVARLLALLLEMHRAAQEASGDAGSRPLRMALAAPTGKAAARLQESLRGAIPNVVCDASIRELIPEQASTIHRLLGVRRYSQCFRHDAERQLPLDVLVVDEASMVDLALMSRLVAALPRSARLILLGDRDQLASVEAGAVLGELCTDALSWSAVMAGRLSGLTGESIDTGPSQAENPLRDAVAVLQHSYRFAGESGIGHLARAVNSGDSAKVLKVLDDPRYPDVVRSTSGLGDGSGAGLLQRAAQEFAPFLDAVNVGAPVSEVFAAFNRYRVLCAHRQGPQSAAQFNELIVRQVRQRYRLGGSGDWYAGRPVMVVRNDYATRLYNGDIGIALPDPARDGQLSVFFEGVDGVARALAPVRLPAHETVYAMTVHKSQGTEFDRVSLLLPVQASGVVTRELVYTGLTRARQWVEIVADSAVLRRAVRQQLLRSGGLLGHWRESSPG